MGKFNSFEDMQIWQKARELNLIIYRLTQTENLTKEFAIKDQLKRATLSISLNIAEGFERKSNKEFTRFLYIAKGSCGEVRTIFYLLHDLNLITEKDFMFLKDKFSELSKQISTLIKYLESSSI